jgi:hypothetical protein
MIPRNLWVVAQDHPEEHIRVLATELHVRIISRDRSWFDDKPGGS